MPRARNSKRHQARMLAFQVLYGLSFSQVQSQDELRQAFMSYPSREDEKTGDLEAHEACAGFAWELVFGVWSMRDPIDALISRFSQNWRIDRIGHIEITVLRLALFELFFRNDTPPKVVINEALELSSHFAEAQARKFINGILDAAVREHTKKQADKA